VDTSAVAAIAAAAEFQERKATLESSIAARREAYISLFGDPNAHLVVQQQQTDAAAAAASTTTAATVPAATKAAIVATAAGTGATTTRSSRSKTVTVCDDDMDTSDAPVAAVIAEQNAAAQQQQQAVQQLLQQHPGPSDADIAKGLFCLVDAHWLKQWVVGQALALPVPKKPAAAKRGRSGSASTAAAAAAAAATAGDGVAPMEVVDVVDDSDTEAANVAAVAAAAAAAGGGSAAVVHTVDDNSGAESDGGAAAIAAVAAAESGSTGSSSSSAAAGEVFKEPIQHAQHLCEHGALHPAATTKFKLVTELVYSMLASVSDDSEFRRVARYALVNFQAKAKRIEFNSCLQWSGSLQYQFERALLKLEQLYVSILSVIDYTVLLRQQHAMLTLSNYVACCLLTGVRWP
jgi:hypothetical protein